MNIEEHLNIPSPVTQIETDWSKEGNVEISLKRDDLIHPIISGNKWRKLSGILKTHKAGTYNKVVTFGGAYSNHLLATACVSSILGVASKGLVRGEEPKQKNTVLLMCELYGMELEFLSREDYKLRCREHGVNNQTLFIPEGGACEQGTLGCEAILDEVELDSYTHVYVSCGTGTTIAGMAKSILKSTNNSIKLYGVQVLKGVGYIQEELKQHFEISNATILDEHHCGGYAKSTLELDEFIKDFVKQTGVLLDPIYTAKLMLAIKKQIENGDLKKESKVLAIHTGGLTGWFGKSSSLFKA